MTERTRTKRGDAESRGADHDDVADAAPEASTTSGTRGGGAVVVVPASMRGRFPINLDIVLRSAVLVCERADVTRPTTDVNDPCQATLWFGRCACCSSVIAYPVARIAHVKKMCIVCARQSVAAAGVFARPEGRAGAF